MGLTAFNRYRKKKKGEGDKKPSSESKNVKREKGKKKNDTKSKN